VHKNSVEGPGVLVSDCVVLTDGVLVLRPPVEEDASAVAEAVQSSLDTLVEWMPWADADYSAVSALEWMREAKAPGRHAFLVCDRRGTVMGTCGLQQADLQSRCIQLGYWLGQSYTGRGYATRAARLAIDHAFGDLDFHRVEILVSVHNQRSRRVAERLGARLEATLTERLQVRGAWHDALLYACVAGHDG
jgi:ribosomal-protein-serine acetyltransferase